MIKKAEILVMFCMKLASHRCDYCVADIVSSGNACLLIIHDFFS